MISPADHSCQYWSMKALTSLVSACSSTAGVCCADAGAGHCRHQCEAGQNLSTGHVRLLASRPAGRAHCGQIVSDTTDGPGGP